MFATLRIAVLIYLGLAFAPGAFARSTLDEVSGESIDAVRAEARTSLVTRLLELAKWCNQNQLFEERDRVWRAVIALEPDNLDARKGLRYARNVDGSWKEPSPRPAKNMNAAALKDLPEKRAQAVRPFAEAILPPIQGEFVPHETRRSVLAEILSVDPDDPEARALLGEIKTEKGWVLKETVAGKTRRADIRAAVEAARAAPPGILPASATADEKKLFDKWKSGAQSGTVRVIGTGDAKACEDMANQCRITGAVFQAVLGVEPPWAEDFGMFLVAGSGEKDAFVAALPNLEDAQKDSLKKTIGGGVPGSWKIALFEPDETKRRDCGVRHALAHLLNRGFEIETAHAWIFEGLGLYLTREICGTRLTWFCTGTGVTNQAKNSPRGRLITGDVNWMNEAYTVLTREKPADLATVLGRDLTTMGIDDVLVSYALAAFLVEGRSDAIPALLKAVGEDAAPADAIRTALGMSVPELQLRLVRWLSERK
ncbi:MAG: hypothetical protein ACKVXR_18770 [Planctomycetota bacterium]